MPTLMPSLLKYFAIVGGILFAGLVGLNAMLEPGGPGPRLVKNGPNKIVVQVDPHASKVERLRAEEAALKLAEKANPRAHPVVVTEPLRLPPLPLEPPAPEPVLQAAVKPAPAAPAQSTPPALTPAEPEHAQQTAQQEAKHKALAEKARKKRVARERARTRAVQEASAASRQQDQIYSSYAPRPNYGPFAQGGFGGGWQGQGGFGSGWGRAW